MLLGKRPRHPMIKRTVSMTGLTLDPSGGGRAGDSLHPADQERPFALGGSGGLDRTILATVSPRAPHRRNYTDFVVESSSFLRACSLCNRRLVPGRDIYMYSKDWWMTGVGRVEKLMGMVVDPTARRTTEGERRDRGRWPVGGSRWPSMVSR
ncbi:hypothetical protein Ancab_029058 [Ancistrocladus abbreviatus]